MSSRGIRVRQNARKRSRSRSRASRVSCGAVACERASLALALGLSNSSDTTGCSPSHRACVKAGSKVDHPRRVMLLMSSKR